VLDHRQNVSLGAIEQVDREEVAGQDRLGLRAEELRPAKAGSARRGVDSGILQNLPHRRTAVFILQTMNTAVQANILDSPLMDPPPSPEEVWEFCLRGIGAGPAE
jgi:hypothetical protein